MSDFSPPVPSLYADAPYTAQRLAVRQNGYAPIPVTGPTATCDKPGKAVLLRDWCSICVSADEGTIRSGQHAHPYWSNTGILCGAGPVKVCAIDCDIRAGEVSESVAGLAARKFGITPLQRVGLPPKILLVYQVETPFAKKLTPKYEMPDGTEAQVEILCMGQQFVAFGIHPDTGQPYRWLTSTPEAVCAADLPLLREQDVSAFLAEAEALLIDHGGRLLVRERMAPLVTGTADADQSRATNEELVSLIRADRGWHNNMLKLTARLVSDGRTDEEILALAAELTTGQYSVEETADDMQSMVDSARKKSFDWHARAPANKSSHLFTPLPDPSGRQPVSVSATPQSSSLRATSRPHMRERMLSPEQCGQARLGYIWKHIVAPGDVGVILAAPNSGKSVFAPYLGYAVAQGRPVFNHRVRQGRVLYVAAEGYTGMQLRVSALRHRYGEADDFRLVDCGNLNEANAAAELLETVGEWQPKLVFIDTLGAAFAGIDENRSDFMGTVVKVLRQVASTGCAALALHHPAKTGDATPRGHGVLNGTLDVTIFLKPRDTSGVIPIALRKNKNGPDDLTFAFRLVGAKLGMDEDGDLITAPIAEELTVSPALNRLKPPSPQGIQMLAVLKGMLEALPDGVREDAFLTECNDRRVSTSDDAKSRGKVIRRIYSALLASGHITARGDLVALAGTMIDSPQLASVDATCSPYGKQVGTTRNWAEPTGTTAEIDVWNHGTTGTGGFRPRAGSTLGSETFSGCDVTPRSTANSNLPPQAPLRCPPASPAAIEPASQAPASKAPITAGHDGRMQRNPAVRQRPPRVNYGAFAAPSASAGSTVFGSHEDDSD